MYHAIVNCELSQRPIRLVGGTQLSITIEEWHLMCIRQSIMLACGLIKDTFSNDRLLYN